MSNKKKIEKYFSLNKVWIVAQFHTQKLLDNKWVIDKVIYSKNARDKIDGDLIKFYKNLFYKKLI